MRVMMLVKGDRDPGHVPGEELMEAMLKYNKELADAGVLLSLDALQWSAVGKRVKFFQGERTVIDGPFGDPKKIVAGYWLLDVESMDEAIEWAKRLPFEAGGEPDVEGEVELRPLFEIEDFN